METQVYNVKDANEAFRTTLKKVLEIGQEIKAAESLSIGSGKTYTEILNYNLTIENPKERLLKNKNRPINLPGAVARFIWMMGANNRLADIEFYWGKRMSSFTDDGYTVPGSSYGARMFNSRPGLDQIEAIIGRLKEDSTTRRAAVSIYQPEDATRESKDIPCTFGLFYHIRDNKLISTIIMRSNNAYILLPYNIFEFSLLAEAISKEIGVNFGRMNYNALSMHIYEQDYVNAKSIISDETLFENIDFPNMPAYPSPLLQIKKLVKLESEIRHASAGLNKDNIKEWINYADKEELHEYWKQFYFLILFFVVNEKVNDSQATQEVYNLINEPYKQYLKVNQNQVIQPTKILDLFGNSPITIQSGDSYQFKRLKSLDNLCSQKDVELIGNGQTPISFSKYTKLKEKFLNPSDSLQLAAREGEIEISKDDFEEAFNEL